MQSHLQPQCGLQWQSGAVCVLRAEEEANQHYGQWLHQSLPLAILTAHVQFQIESLATIFKIWFCYFKKVNSFTKEKAEH